MGDLLTQICGERDSEEYRWIKDKDEIVWWNVWYIRDEMLELKEIKFKLQSEYSEKKKIINSAAWDKQDMYVIDDKWSLSCSINFYCTFIGELRVVEYAKAYNKCINTKNYITAVLLLRAIFESYIAVYYLRVNFHELIDGNYNNKVLENIAKVINGVRYDFDYPWGGEIKVDSINILTMLKKLLKAYPSAEDDYNFLSNFCHPNNYPTTFLLLAKQMYGAHDWIVCKNSSGIQSMPQRFRLITFKGFGSR